MIADLTCFPHRWRRGFLECFKDTSSECIPAEKNSVAICLRLCHIFTGLILLFKGKGSQNVGRPGPRVYYVGKQPSVKEVINDKVERSLFVDLIK